MVQDFNGYSVKGVVLGKIQTEFCRLLVRHGMYDNWFKTCLLVYDKGYDKKNKFPL